jgi:hypothetical protein
MVPCLPDSLLLGQGLPLKGKVPCQDIIQGGRGDPRALFRFTLAIRRHFRPG